LRLTVEATKDITFRALPVTPLEAEEMIRETTVHQLLSGYRGFPEVDVHELAQFLVDVGSAALTIRGLHSLDLNPVIATATSLVPVDARVVVFKVG
jgi:acetate---CoA ligase (ADP-forming)